MVHVVFVYTEVIIIIDFYCIVCIVCAFPLLFTSKMSDIIIGDWKLTAQAVVKLYREPKMNIQSITGVCYNLPP